ncbi:MAG: hypothetical protein H8D32_02585 [Dehalococcoidia bacterium]|nr:hypothetical protein [Dehalococcoidia bacterium]
MERKGIKRGDFGLGELPSYATNPAVVDLIFTTKQDFEALLKKACEQKPKPSPKSSKT